jgi:hypothetical protein
VAKDATGEAELELGDYTSSSQKTDDHSGSCMYFVGGRLVLDLNSY